MGDSGDLGLWRRLFVVSSFVGYAWYIVTRKTFAVFMAHLMHDLKWREEDIGATSSSFVVGFTLSQIAFSTLPDRISLRWVYCFCLLGSSVMNIILGLFHHSLVSFAALWLVNGFFQGFGWPAILRMTKLWFSPSECGRILGVAGVGGNLAGLCAPALFQTLAVSLGGWRGVFVAAGVSGVAIAMLLGVITRGSPKEVLYGSGSAHAQSNVSGKLNGKQSASMDVLLRNSLLWVVSLSRLICNFTKVVMCDWGPIYLMYDKKWEQQKAVLSLGAYEMGGVVGCLLIGFLADLLMNKYRHLGSYARLPVVIGCSLLAVVSLQLMRDAQPQHTVLIVVLLFVLGVCLFGPIALFGIVATEMAPPGLEGLSYAVLELSAQAGGFMAGFPFSALLISVGWTSTLWILEMAVLVVVLVNIVTLIVRTGSRRAVKVE